MPIDVVCPSCNRRLRVPDRVAGKKIRCPKCEGVLPVPGSGSQIGAAAGGDGSVISSASSISVGSVVSSAGKKWYMKTPDGSQYGPVPRPELDQWLNEGRITEQCQLLEEGAPQWQWAVAVYPQLNPAAPSEPEPTTAVDDNPFAGIGGTTSSSSAGSSVSSSDPFALAGANTSPTARVRGGRRGGGGRSRRTGGGKQSGTVTAVAVVNYIFGGLGVLFGLACALLGPVALHFLMGAAQEEAARNGQGSAEAAEAAQLMGSVGTAIFVVIGIIMILSASVTLLAGYGVQKRAQWGRILTLVLGGLHGCMGLLNLVTLNPAGLLNLAYGIFVFVVLLNKQNAEEFH